MPTHLNHERNLVRMSELRADADRARRAGHAVVRRSVVRDEHGRGRLWLLIRRARSA